MNSEEDTWSRLPHLDTEALDILRQSWKRILHPILGEHLGDVEVGSDTECHRYREVPVAGLLAAHVDHILDAIDLLLEWRRDSTRDGLRRCARIACRDLDRRRHNLWILRDRQHREGTQSKQSNKGAQNDRKTRSVNKKVG